MTDFNIQPLGGQVKPVQQTSLADMMNIAGAAQAYQQRQQMNPLELQKSQTELSRLQQLTPLEIQRAQAEANVSSGTEQPRITSATQAASTATTGAESAKFDFANKQVRAVADRLTGLINNPLVVSAERNPDAVNADVLSKIVQDYGMEQANAMGIPPDKANELIQPYLKQKPAALRQFLKDKLLSTLDAGSRVSTLQPSGVPVGTGAGGATVGTSEFSQYPQGTALPGTTFTTQLPPTTPVIATEGDGSGLPVGTPYYKGPTGAKPVVSGLGAAGTANIAIANEDWNQTYKASTDAQQRKGVLQTINKLAPEAFTGVGGSRKELAAGIVNFMGIPAYEAEKASTDELMKNANLLALAGGNTDAARALAEVANPNKKMNLPAIQAVVKQLIGVENMKTARADFLGQYRNNPDQYIAQSALFNKFADSRLFQEMDAQDVAKLKASMSPQQIAEMTAKIRQAKQLGIIKFTINVS